MKQAQGNTTHLTARKYATIVVTLLRASFGLTMRANSQFAIAIHCLTLLALSEKPVSSSDMAGSAGTNPAFVRRIIGALNRAGLVETQLGSSGGVLLKGEPIAITLEAIYAATHQLPLLSLHQSKPLASCICGGNIEAVIQPIFHDAEQALHNYLAGVTLADVVAGIQKQADLP